MKILMYTVINVNDALGSSLHVRKVAEKLTKRGHDFVLLAPLFPGEKKTHNFSIIYLGPTGKFILLIKFLQDINAGLKLLGVILKGWKPEAVYSRFGLSTIFLPILCKLLRIPYFTEVNGAHKADLKYKGTSRFLMPFFLAIERLNYICSRKIVSVSDELSDLIRKMRWVKANQVVTVLNGVEVENYKLNGQCDPDFRRRLRGEAQLALGFVGRFEKWHGLSNVVEALALIKNQYPDLATKIKLILIGIGTEQPNLERQIVQTKTSAMVHFTGWVENNDLPKYLSCVEIALAPYMPYSSTDGSLYPCPLKILEYLAAEKWILTVDTAFSGIIRENNAGYILNEVTPRRVAEAILWAWKNREHIFKNMKKMQSVIEQNYSWDVTAQKLEQIMQKGSSC